MTEPAILYTTLARIVLPPAGAGSGALRAQGAQADPRDAGQGKGGAGGGSMAARALRAGGAGEPQAAALRSAVDAMSAALCGLQARLSELW